MKITVQAAALERDARLLQSATKKMHAQLWAIVRRVSLATMARVKTAMPVDTGRARASWGVWGGANAGFARVLRRASKGKLTKGQASNYAKASPSDAVWKEEELALRVTQGSNLPYIEPLNDGHSKQAPRGFIDLAASQADLALQREVEKAIEVIWSAAMPSASVPGSKP